MECSHCERFDPSARRCLDGKINPRHYSQALEAAKVFGPRALCVFNDHRERVLGSRTRLLPPRQTGLQWGG